MADYTVNYEDERFKDVEAQKQQALTDVNKTYDDMINQSDQFYQTQIDASKDWAEKQQQLQQEQTDFTIEQIEQQKQQAEKDYKKEQTAAYVDYKKQSNEYGAQAEQMAANGLSSTGYSETSKVGMYNTYQNRVAVAKESVNQAILSYNNAMKEAQLQNSSAQAEIAYNALQQQLQFALEGFQYKNTLVSEKTQAQQNVENTYYGRWQDVLSQINQENALAEEVRQYNENLKLQQQELAYQKAQDERNYQLQLKQLAEEQRQFNESLAASKSSSSSGSASINKNAVSTAYYQGDLNSDANVYGTFSNGYQPKGISGHGKLSKSGATYSFDTQTLYGQKQNVTQNVWTAEDGTYWYWDGVDNKYKQLKYNSQKETFSPM